MNMVKVKRKRVMGLQPGERFVWCGQTSRIHLVIPEHFLVAKTVEEDMGRVKVQTYNGVTWNVAGGMTVYVTA